jgi:hypothetical protein
VRVGHKKIELSYLVGGGLSCQSLSSSGAAQLPPDEIKNIFDVLGESGSELKRE